MKTEEKLATSTSSAIPSETTAKGLQLVGLIMKLGLFLLTWIERRRGGIPPIMLGTVSESVITWRRWIDMQGNPNHHPPSS